LKFKPVQIKWYDATRYGEGWSDEIHDKGANVIYSWGCLMSKHKNITKLLQSYDTVSGKWNGLLIIPTKTILEIKYLEEK